MRHKILIVDDEKAILEMLRINLEAEEYIVYLAKSGEEALTQLSVEPELILLDINMPGMSGLELCQKIRDHVNCPIIFLTARITEQDKIAGLMNGGDDYITKPFSIEELLARIQAHLRREERSHTATRAKFTDRLIIDYDKRSVIYKEQEIEFSNKEFEIMTWLSRNPGIVFSREKLYEKIWGYESEGDSIVIKEHIRKIRNKLSEYTDEDYIETVWGVGYKWRK